jgi:hypothetical protein
MVAFLGMHCDKPPYCLRNLLMVIGDKGSVTEVVLNLRDVI